jgi:uncharacterized protein YjeT (DUF2065 family)
MMSLLNALTLVFVVFGLCGFLLCPTSKRMKGRYVSRPLLRRLGLIRTLELRLSLTVFFMAVIVADLLGAIPNLVYDLTAIAFYGWWIDDWLFSDDKPPRRRRAWARQIRLLMPKPVQIRPALRVR